MLKSPAPFGPGTQPRDGEMRLDDVGSPGRSVLPAKRLILPSGSSSSALRSFAWATCRRRSEAFRLRGTLRAVPRRDHPRSKDEHMAHQSGNPFDGKTLKIYDEIDGEKLWRAIETSARSFEAWKQRSCASRGAIFSSQTDRRAARGDWPLEPRQPFIPGQEGTSRVTAVGAGVTRVKGRDRVEVPWLCCGCSHCECCPAGWDTVCAGAEVGGYPGNGGLVEDILADPTYGAHIPAAAAVAPITCEGVTDYE